MLELRKYLSAIDSATLSSTTRTGLTESRATSHGTQDLAMNLTHRTVGTVTASDTGFRAASAGVHTVGGFMYTKIASSAVWALSGTTLTSSQVCMWLLTLDAVGSGVATQGNIASTSAGCSLPATPAGACPIAQVIVASGSSICVPGTTTFSLTVSATGSVVITELYRRT